jgi:hypothetical protein
MEKQIQILLLTNNLLIISEIVEIFAEIGGPDCKLINPYLISSDDTLIPWLSNYTESKEILISSDKILTLVEPSKKYLNTYLENTA